jgi:DNA-binding winged helix-turn-helix (wHTH) protein
MNVNSVLRAAFRNRVAVLFGVFTLIVAIFFTASSFTKLSGQDLFAKRVNLAIREIGHRLLLEAGDSTSLVLPVKEISTGVFLLEFENDFGFMPDTLIALTKRLLTKTGLSDYTVTVHECFKPEIVYGFQIGKADKSIKACNGRNQPRRCYNIEIAFASFTDTTIDYASVRWLVAAFMLFVTLVFTVKRFERKSITTEQIERKENPTANSIAAPITLGKFTFHVPHQKLILGNEVIVLTDKECRVLELLQLNFGQLTAREDLIQQVWTNEGVITGRSLDVFISKLRKKLSLDPDLRITNIHGKGYRLEVVGAS